MEHELRGEGPTAVLVHGLTVDRRVMIEAFDELLAEAGVRRFTSICRGTARPRAIAARASADAFVEELAALVRATLAPAPDRAGELEAPLVVGYSYGGYLAQALVRELGGARGLLLVCPVVEPDFARRTQPPRRIAVHEPELTIRADPREREAFAEVAVQMTRPVLERFQRAVHPANIAADAAVVTAVRARYALSRPHRRCAGAAGRAVDDRVRTRRSLGGLAGRGAAGGACSSARTSWCCPTAGTCCRSSSRGVRAGRSRLPGARAVTTSPYAVRYKGLQRKSERPRYFGGGALPLTAETVTMICVCWISSFASILTRRLAPRQTT